MQIYGLVGKKGSGKDTLSSFVRGFDPHFKVLHFADRLKEICAEVFGVDPRYFHEPQLKEVPIPTIVIDNHIEGLSLATGLEIKPRGLVAETPRQLLQYVGTDYVRSICDSYWVDYIRGQILRLDDKDKKVLVADARFKNEAQVIRDVGGKVVVLLREGQQSSDQHKSETELTEIQPDSVFYFKNGDFTLHAKIAKAISENQFEQCQQDDWRKQQGG